MLTAKENMRELIRGGNPDRFVNQYEAVALLMHPYILTQPLLQRGQENVVNGWGVTNSFPANTPGSFPVHTPDKIVVKDIENWLDYDPDACCDHHEHHAGDCGHDHCSEHQCRGN